MQNNITIRVCYTEHVDHLTTTIPLQQRHNKNLNLFETFQRWKKFCRLRRRRFSMKFIDNLRSKRSTICCRPSRSTTLTGGAKRSGRSWPRSCRRPSTRTWGCARNSSRSSLLATLDFCLTATAKGLRSNYLLLLLLLLLLFCPFRCWPPLYLIQIYSIRYGLVRWIVLYFWFFGLFWSCTKIGIRVI